MGNVADNTISCKAPGNPRCNPKTWTNYTDGCCSEKEKCTIGEGDCNSHSECYGSLVCTANSCPKSKGFHERASCCEQPSAELLLGTT